MFYPSLPPLQTVQLNLFLRIFRRLGLTFSEYLKALWPAISRCVVMALALETLKMSTAGSWPLPVRLVSEILVGMVAYGMMLILLHRNYLQGILRFQRSSRAEALERA